MADVFVSYAREDQQFVRWLTDALSERGREAWVDWEGIEPSDEWQRSINEAIDAADAFLFVLSPDSLKSMPCLDELDRAASEHKRVIGVVCRDVEGQPVAPVLEAVNWIFVREFDDRQAGLEELVRALDLDLDLVRVHTRVLTRARAWEAIGRRPTPLLRGEELRAAQRWLERAAAGAEPKPTGLQADFVRESGRRATRRLQLAVAGSLIVALVAIVLSMIALIERAQARHQARVAQSRALAASAEATLGSDPESSIALAVQALGQQQTPQALHALSHALEASRLRLLFKQPSPVKALAFSPDGGALASGGLDGGVRLWTLAARRQLWVSRVGGLPVSGVAFDRADDLLVVARSNNVSGRSGCSVEVRSAKTGAFERALGPEEHSYCMRFAAFVGPTRIAAVGTDRGSVTFFNADSGSPIASLDSLRAAPGDDVAGLAVSFDGRAIAATVGHVVRLVTLPDGRPIGTVGAFGEIFNPDQVAFGPRDSEVVIGSEYDTETDDVQFGSHAVLDNQLGSSGVSWSADGRLAAAAIRAGTEVWSAVSGRLVEILHGQTSQSFNPVAFSASGMLAAGAEDGYISLWAPNPDLPVRSTSAQVGTSFAQLYFAAGAPDARLAALGDATQYVYVTDSAGRVLRRIALDGDGPFALTAGGELAYTRAGALTLVRLPSDARVGSFPLHDRDPAIAVSASANGGVIAALTEAGELNVVSAGRVVSSRIPFSPFAVTQTNVLSLSSDGRQLIVVGMPGANEISVLRTSDLHVLHSYPGTAAAFARGPLLAIERPDLTIAVLRRQDFATETVLRGDTYGESQLAFSPGGRLTAALDQAAVLRVWDTADGSLLITRHIVDGIYPGRLPTPQIVLTRAGLALVGTDAVEAFDACSACLDVKALLASARSRLQQIRAIAGR